MTTVYGNNLTFFLFETPFISFYLFIAYQNVKYYIDYGGRNTFPDFR